MGKGFSCFYSCLGIPLELQLLPCPPILRTDIFQAETEVQDKYSRIPESATRETDQIVMWKWVQGNKIKGRLGKDQELVNSSYWGAGVLAFEMYFCNKDDDKQGVSENN